MGIFRKRGIGILKLIFLIAFGALAVYLLFRGIITENITTGMR